MAAFQTVFLVVRYTAPTDSSAYGSVLLTNLPSRPRRIFDSIGNGAFVDSRDVRAFMTGTALRPEVDNQAFLPAPRFII